jgi:hypothetical protein
VTAEVPDRFAAARAVADAVLYEGYVLYPYRASSRKNQVRWQFGVLVPEGYHHDDPSERWQTRTEVLVAAGPTSVLRIRVRGLHLQHRTVEAATTGGGFAPTDAVDVDGVTHVEWDEGVDAVIELPPLLISDLELGGYEQPFRLPEASTEEHLYDADGTLRGRLVRRREAVNGTVTVAVAGVGGSDAGVGGGGYSKVVVAVANATGWPPAIVVSKAALAGIHEQNRVVGAEAPVASARDVALARSYIAVHTMLAVDGGRFVSLLDPPAPAAQAAAACHSDGSYPVLIGGDDVVLSSPIILYDHPEVAPESPGDLYDSTEIDEILALRIMTLTDEEKAEARGTDARAAAVIDRCDDMPPEIWERLHGALRAVEPSGSGGLDPPAPEQTAEEMVAAAAAPWWDPGADAAVDPNTDHVVIAGTDVRRGTPVVLRPTRRADAQDLFLKDRPATVAGVFRDVDDNEYVAVTLDDDPMAAELEWQGRYFYFYPDELEPQPQVRTTTSGTPA